MTALDFHCNAAIASKNIAPILQYSPNEGIMSSRNTPAVRDDSKKVSIR